MPIRIGQEIENDFSNPLGLLSDCHRRIERFLDVLIEITGESRGGALSDDQRHSFEAALRYFREASPKHTRDEEESLFPRMTASSDERVLAAISTLEELHGDHTIAELSHLEVEVLGRCWLSEGLLTSDSIHRLTEVLNGLRSIYQRHIAVEEHEIFPLAGRILSSADILAVGREMARRRSIDLEALASNLNALSGADKHMTTSSRRHDSLIPLSREHQYALLLCLRLHRGLPEHDTDADWLRMKAGHVVQFFESELVIHFQAEEEFLFPALRAFPDAVPIIDELLAQHQHVRRLCDQLRKLHEGSPASTLKEFADLLEAHIRKEERELFPIYEQKASPETMARVEHQIFSLIGSASQPQNPELLR